MRLTRSGEREGEEARSDVPHSPAQGPHAPHPQQSPLISRGSFRTVSSRRSERAPGAASAFRTRWNLCCEAVRPSAAKRGAWLGWQPLPFVVMIASAGTLAVVLLSRSKRRDIAFGPGLALAFALVWLAFLRT